MRASVDFWVLMFVMFAIRRSLPLCYFRRRGWL